MSEQFEGKVTLIVGGTSGIGHAAALAFASEGGSVVVSGRNITAGEKVEGQIKEMGEGVFIRADISKASDIENLVLRTIKRYGRLDCAVNNEATTGGEGLIHESSEESWDLVMDTNLKGLWLCMRYEIAQMLRQGHGSIVNTTSIGGLVGFARNPIYAASKHGIVGLTRSAALFSTPRQAFESMLWLQGLSRRR
jgi:NAD(P)-dependent dehydrogenase (short-subunit alcohol dehydrogenase family)